MPQLFRVHIDSQCDMLCFDDDSTKNVLLPLDGSYKAKRLQTDCVQVHYKHGTNHCVQQGMVLTTEIGGLVLRDEELASCERLYRALIGCEQIALRCMEEFFILLNPAILHGDVEDYGVQKHPPLLCHIDNEPLEHIFCFDGFVNNDHNFAYLSRTCGFTGMRFELVHSW